MPVSALTAWDPEVVGPWRLIGRLGQGGMGVVYLGRRATPSGEQSAAVKVISADLQGHPEALGRFRREIAALMSLDDPGVARILAADLDDTRPWYAVDLVDGPTLQAKVDREGPIDPQLWPSLSRMLLTTLSRVHARQITHRDLKPANILMGGSGPVLIDFGISVLWGATSLTLNGGSPLTRGWASPEQLLDREVAASADIFSAGLVLAWSATGRHPFQTSDGADHGSLSFAIAHGQPNLSGIPESQREWLAPMLAREASARPSADDLIAALDTLPPDAAPGYAHAAQQVGWLSAARSWWQLAADSGDPSAMVELGDLADAQGQPESARSWFRLAADAGSAAAMARLGQASHHDGDSAGARRWWETATRLGDPDAMVGLGQLASQEGDLAEALTWWQQAADTGHRGAQALVSDATTAGQYAPDSNESPDGQESGGVAGPEHQPPARLAAPPPAPPGIPASPSPAAPQAVGPPPAHTSPGPPAQAATPPPPPPGAIESTHPTTPRARPSGRRNGLRVGAAVVAVLAALSMAVIALGWPRSSETGDAPPERGIATTPVRVKIPSSGGSSSAIRIAQGETSSCLITRDGWAQCWGANDSGQLGSPGGDADTPRPVDRSGALDGRRLARVSVGASHACALDEQGRAYCWGSNEHGQLGTGSPGSRSTDPVPVRTDAALDGGRLRFIGASGASTCAQSDAGELFCWGANDRGQLGDGTTTDRAEPTRVSGGDLGSRPIRRFAVGDRQTCAVDTAGAAYCWGANDSGQLGDGSRDDSTVPVRVIAGPSGEDGPYDNIHTGADSTCAWAPEGEAYCWGANGSGQLGDGTTTDSTSPVRVSSDNETYSSIRVGRGSVCAATTAGSLRCWGANDSGQLGNGTTTNASVPVAVGRPDGSGPVSAAQVSAGSATMCALADDGDVWCWGSDESGLLGNGSD